MEETVEWFERELGPHGFTLTPLMYDPNSFTPMMGILYTYVFNDEGQTRCVKLRAHVVPELANDLHAWGRTHNDMVDEMREMVIEQVIREVEAIGQPNPFGYEPKPINFTPKKEITTFKFI